MLQTVPTITNSLYNYMFKIINMIKTINHELSPFRDKGTQLPNRMLIVQRHLIYYTTYNRNLKFCDRA